jgi:hypothetical protein
LKGGALSDANARSRARSSVVEVRYAGRRSVVGGPALHAN